MSQKTAQQFASRAKLEMMSNPNLDDKTKKEVADVIDKAAAQFTVPDTSVYRIAVGSVALIGVSIILGSILITMVGGGSSKIPEFFAVALGAAIGALAGMLVASK